MQPYEATTENITITVRPLYLDGQSDAIARKFVFAYFIRIENNGHEPVQLLRRHLFIYGFGGLVAPFIGIKLIDMLMAAVGWA